MNSSSSAPLQLLASDPIPGLRAQSGEDWAQIQLRLRQGETLTPLLPLGADAGLVWIPKNGCSTLKRAWLQLQGTPTAQLTADIHQAVLPSTHWLRPAELSAVAEHRALVAIWRDPIDRYVSACRSHLIELTSGRIHAKFDDLCQGNPQAYEQALAFHQQLFAEQGVRSFDDNVDPVEAMNAAALQLPAWIQCHLDWSHHTIPQVSYLGGDPRPYATVLGMEQIDWLLQQWGQSAGIQLDTTPQHVSQNLEQANPWRRLHRDQLSPEAIAALHRFYAADWAFLELAQRLLGGVAEAAPHGSQP
ncbi:sulfotransferase family 2 domain-containing protein [Synechococcus sp. WH 8016]|uniref:sulfotransferase family 2 domain-containing protein n=1 Tax=Synechococcus sp. WH 8016 TaxID=166318 RepID=UPI00022D7F70|nr:sulfotransferase family 2 domain-containing protein [Synechococcus sp. WH 8016]EHA58653.1 hypothetical protein Syn8016DRAFT_2969 [Synechococcus sp. WH 8016]